MERHEQIGFHDAWVKAGFGWNTASRRGNGNEVALIDVICFSGIRIDFNEWIGGLSSLVSYSYYDRDPSKRPYQSMTNRAYQNGDTHQVNLDILYKLSGSLKGTELKLRLMDQENDTTATYDKESSNQELRAEVNYLFWIERIKIWG